jgi:hypothetical protein
MNPFLITFLKMANLENERLVQINGELLDNHLPQSELGSSGNGGLPLPPPEPLLAFSSPSRRTTTRGAENRGKESEGLSVKFPRVAGLEKD